MTYKEWMAIEFGKSYVEYYEALHKMSKKDINQKDTKQYKKYIKDLIFLRINGIDEYKNKKELEKQKMLKNLIEKQVVFRNKIEKTFVKYKTNYINDV